MIRAPKHRVIGRREHVGWWLAAAGVAAAVAVALGLIGGIVWKFS